MNKKQYNNVIDYTLTHEAEAQSADSLKTARAVFNNMGVALPNGEISEVYETLKTNDYMGWKSCTMQEAQKAADSGTAAIGISKDRIVILSAADEEDPVTQTASVMTISETTPAVAVSDLEYYSYDYGTEDANPYLTKHFDCLVGTRMTNRPNSMFESGQCIEYAMIRMREVEGMVTPGIAYRNPLDWLARETGDNKSGYYFAVNSTSYDILTSNYCAIFADKKTGGEPGHVIYLEYVQKNNNGDIINVYFTEANWAPSNNGQWDSRDGILKKMAFSNFKNDRTNFRGLIVQTRNGPNNG